MSSNINYGFRSRSTLSVQGPILSLTHVSPFAETVFAKIRIVDTVFEQVCQMLHSRFYQLDTQLSVSTVRRLLLLLSKADSSLVEVRHRECVW